MTEEAKEALTTIGMYIYIYLFLLTLFFVYLCIFLGAETTLRYSI
jgi:hypothetical protein